MTVEEAIREWQEQKERNAGDGIRLRRQGDTHLAFERYQENLLIDRFIDTLKALQSN
jgi:hypothetical protein